MQYLKPKPITNRLFKLMCLFFVLLVYSTHVFSQKQDTIPVKKNNVLNKILSKVIGGNKDTIKPKEQPKEQPNIMRDHNRISRTIFFIGVTAGYPVGAIGSTAAWMIKIAPSSSTTGTEPRIVHHKIAPNIYSTALLLLFSILLFPFVAGWYQPEPVLRKGLSKLLTQ